MGQARRPPDPSFRPTGKGLCKPTLTHSARLDLTGARRCWVEVVAPLPMTPLATGGRLASGRWSLPAVPFGPWCADAWRRTVAVALALFGGRGYVMRVCIVGASGKLPPGCPRVRGRDGAGGAGLRGAGRAPGVLLRWHITRGGQDVYSRQLKWKVRVLGGFGKLVQAVDLDDQVEPAGGCSPAAHGGPSCGQASSKRARARAFRCGAGMWVTPFWPATSPGGWTSPCSWWRPWRTTS